MGKTRVRAGARPAWTRRAALVAVAGAALAAVAAGAVSAGIPGRQAAVTAMDPAKQAALDAEAAARSAGPVAAKPALAQAALPHGTPYPVPPRQGGIVREVNQGPFRPTEFRGADFWQGAAGGVWVQVYAGSDLEAAGPVGALRLYSLPVDPNAPGGADPVAVGDYRPPTAEASLSIVSVRGSVLTLRGASGRTLTFDAATRSWGAG
jgi:hypothetical protein